MQETINNLYHIFNAYTTSNMHYCDCGCIDERDIKKLASKPLKLLEEDDFSSYHGSALYTWGDTSHYKHFLPRILEVHSLKEGHGIIDLSDIIPKLKYAQWESWPKNEIEAIKQFVWKDWDNKINKRFCEHIHISDIESYMFFFPLSNLLQAWKITEYRFALQNFVYFFHFNMNILTKERQTHHQELNQYFKTIPSLNQILEQEFFRVDDIDEDYSWKISILLQML